MPLNKTRETLFVLTYTLMSTCQTRHRISIIKASENETCEILMLKKESDVYFALDIVNVSL